MKSREAWGCVWHCRWLCLCSRAAEGMLLSGVLFTFWAQLVWHHPSLCLSLPLTLTHSLSLSFLLSQTHRHSPLSLLGTCIHILPSIYIIFVLVFVVPVLFLTCSLSVPFQIYISLVVCMHVSGYRSSSFGFKLHPALMWFFTVNLGKTSKHYFATFWAASLPLNEHRLLEQIPFKPRLRDYSKYLTVFTFPIPTQSSVTLAFTLFYLKWQCLFKSMCVCRKGGLLLSTSTGMPTYQELEQDMCSNPLSFKF